MGAPDLYRILAPDLLAPLAADDILQRGHIPPDATAEFRLVPATNRIYGGLESVLDVAVHNSKFRVCGSSLDGTHFLKKFILRNSPKNVWRLGKFS